MKKLIALILSLALMLTFAACNVQPESPDTGAATMKKIVVTVVHGDGTTKEFIYETEEKFLGPVLEADGLIQGNAGPYGMEITQVDGETAVYNTDKAYWALYEGAEYALQGIDTTPVTDGGTYKLEYTRG